jgi:hypothetical protein
MSQPGSSDSKENSSGAQRRLPHPKLRGVSLSPGTRRSFIRMFLVGRSVRSIAQHYRGRDLPALGGEAIVSQELREEMILGGSMERHRAS